MAKLKTLKALAKKHPECLAVHSEIKELIPEADALKLLENGFTDCSFWHDEAPSFYIPQKWADDGLAIMAVDDTDDDYNRISDKIKYVIMSEKEGFYTVLDSINDAIDYHNGIGAQQ